MTFVILTSGIDLSVGSVLALTGVLAASLEHQGWPVLLVVAVALSIGSLLGLANGWLICKGKVTPFVVTLGTMSVARGVAHLFTDAKPISRFRPGFLYLATGEILHVPMPILLFLASVAAAAVLLQRTRLGRYLYAIGGNVRAAKLSGIPVDRYTTLAYVLCGLTAAARALDRHRAAQCGRVHRRDGIRVGRHRVGGDRWHEPLRRPRWRVGHHAGGPFDRHH